MSPTEIKPSVLIAAACQALLGEISPAFREVAIRVQGDTIDMRFVFDGPISDEDRQSASCAATEVIAEFPEHQIREEYVRVDAPERVQRPGTGWHLVYQRREK